MVEKNPFEGKKYPWFTNVTPCYNEQDRIADCIMSVLNQDYPYTELIVVNDGSTDKSRKRILDCQAKMTPEQRARFKFIDLKENKGACYCRNLGAAQRHPESKYLSFLPGDAFLYPGAIKYWVRELETHTEFDGIYGGYRFIKEKTPFGLQNNEGYNIMGDMFDPYVLETSNYIDGTFPIRAELFDKMGGWDEDIKSLQDYEYWLRAVKNFGAKLIYSPSLFFETDLPHKGGLSFDSNEHWLERMDQIKKKLNIPIRDMCVIGFGAQFHAVATAKMLDADFSVNPNFKPNHYQSFYIMGGYPMFADRMAAALKGYNSDQYSPAKFIIHWIGSDLMALRELPRRHLDMYVEWLKNIIDVHLVEAKHTQKELFDLTGIKAKIVPLPSARMYDIKPFPKKPTVAVYQPSGDFNRGLYCGEWMEEVAAKMPDVEFIFYGMTELDKKRKKNISFRPFNRDPKSVEKLIEDTTVLLRITIHDGLPLSVGEFASAGRNVVTNVPVPHVRHISGEVTPDGIVIALRAALKDGPNVKGAEYYKKLFNPAKFKKTMRDIAKYDAGEYWEKRSRTWSKAAESYFDKHEQKVVKNVLRRQKFKSVIDVGCGDGIWSDLFPEEYLGVDIAKGNIEVARKKYPNREFIQSSVEDMPDKIQLGEKYDVAFCHTLLMHITDEKIDKAIEGLRKFANKAIIIEPNKIETGFYQTKHDIPKLFDVELTIPMPKRTLYLVKL